MAAFNTQKVLSVHHWTDAYFTFTCTRDESLRFENGQFVMVGLMVDGKPLMRAYSVASANWEEHLEFFSIKVQDGPLTSRLQHLKAGDEVLVSKKPTGTLICGDLNPGKHLYLLSTGTGIAPFLSITKDPSREEFPHRGHITDLMMSGKMFEDIGLPPINPQDDRAMLCGSPAMLKDTSGVLNHFGLTVSPKMGQRGEYLIERAFVDQ
jgi:ferredoxin--NADP+ reductase